MKKYIIRHKTLDIYIAERAGSWSRWEPKREDAMEFTSADLLDMTTKAREFVDIIEVTPPQPKRDVVAYVVKRRDEYWGNSGWTKSMALARRFPSLKEADDYVNDGDRIVALVRPRKVTP